MFNAVKLISKIDIHKRYGSYLRSLSGKQPFGWLGEVILTFVL